MGKKRKSEQRRLKTSSGDVEGKLGECAFQGNKYKNISVKECLTVSGTVERLSKMTIGFGTVERTGDLVSVE